MLSYNTLAITLSRFSCSKENEYLSSAVPRLIIFICWNWFDSMRGFARGGKRGDTTCMNEETIPPIILKFLPNHKHRADMIDCVLSKRRRDPPSPPYKLNTFKRVSSEKKNTEGGTTQLAWFL